VCAACVSNEDERTGESAANVRGAPVCIVGEVEFKCDSPGVVGIDYGVFASPADGTGLQVEQWTCVPDNPDTWIPCIDWLGCDVAIDDDFGKQTMAGECVVRDTL
jgi:hypothetical protein